MPQHSARRLLLLALPLFTACTGESAAPPANPPRLTFAAPLQNVGEVEAGTPMQRDFAFTNRGGSDLTVDKLRAACGCTATLEGAHVVPPGGDGRIQLRCDTTPSSGRQRHTVSVYTNDPTIPVVVVRMVGTVRTDVSVAPSPFYVGRVHRGERVSRDGIVRWHGDPADVVADASAPFRVEVASPPTSDSMETSFSLVMKSDARTGPLAGRLLVHNGAQRLVRTVAVVGEIVPDLSVLPGRAVLEPPAAGTVSAAVLVQNDGPRSVHTNGTDWRLGTATVETLADGERYRVALTLKQPAQPESELVIRTDHPEQPVLRVPVVLATAMHP